MSIFFKSFDEELEDIVKQGDTSQEYRNLFKKIVRLHKKHFTEENLPTAENYLQELLREAIEDIYQTDRIEGLLNKITLKEYISSLKDVKPENKVSTSKFKFINAN